MTDSDIEPLYNLLSDPAVMKYLEEPFTHKRTEDFLKTQGLTVTPRIQAVEDKNHTFIGYVIYHDYDEDSKEIGWVLKKEKWGQGLANLLTRQLIIKAFSEGKDVVIECVPEQEATRNIAKKNNFTLIENKEGLDVYRLYRKA
jgi:ribosomal-protein-alanine N-acetyltransferase